MQWLAWKPICAAGVILCGGWFGYHHYVRHEYWSRWHWNRYRDERVYRR